MTICDLVIHNDGQRTRRQNNNVIDLVLTSAPLTHLISFCCTLTHEKVTSDHVPIVFEEFFDKEDVHARTKIIKQLKKST